MIALNADLEIWPTPLLILHRGLKSAKFGLSGAVVSKRSNISLILLLLLMMMMMMMMIMMMLLLLLNDFRPISFSKIC